MMMTDSESFGETTRAKVKEEYDSEQERKGMTREYQESRVIAPGLGWERRLDKSRQGTSFSCPLTGLALRWTLSGRLGHRIGLGLCCFRSGKSGWHNGQQ